MRCVRKLGGGQTVQRGQQTGSDCPNNILRRSQFHHMEPLQLPREELPGPRHWGWRPRGLTFTWWGLCGLCYGQPSLSSPFYSVLVTISVFLALSAVFQSINSPGNSPFSHCLISALLVLSTRYLCIKVSFSPHLILCGWLGLKHQLTNQLTN